MHAEQLPPSCVFSLNDECPNIPDRQPSQLLVSHTPSRRLVNEPS